jgi:hypothetical protein
MCFTGEVTMMKCWIAKCYSAAWLLSPALVIGAQLPPNTPEVAITVSGCLASNTGGVFTLTEAKTEKNAPGAPVSTTWVLEVEPIAAGMLGMNQRVGQRVEVVGRVNTDASKATATLQVQTLKPIAGECSLGRAQNAPLGRPISAHSARQFSTS